LFSAAKPVEVAEPADPHAVEPSKPERVPADANSPQAELVHWRPGQLVRADANKATGPRIRITPDCLAAYYDFSELDSQTGRVRDKSGNRFDLATVGPRATVVDGVVGKGVMINGGYFEAKGNPLKGADHFTVSLWFKTAEPMNNHKLLAAAVWSGGNEASGWNIGTHYSEFWADNQEGSLRGDPGWDRNVEFRKSEWNHLVVSYDGAFVREYINGEPSAKIHGTGRAVGDGAPMLLGAWLGFRYEGALDEVRIYRRALAEVEVQALHRVAGQ
jgi:hypothetical protein